MGLDMYLTKRKYLGWNYDHRKEGIKLPDLSTWGIDSSKITYVEMAAMYWRKANAIHQWFVNNVQDGTDDCGDYYVSKEALELLLEDVKQVLKVPAMAGEILPPQGGFFFGSTDIDKYYIEDMEYTKKGLEAILKTYDQDDCSYEYHSSW